MVLQLDSLMSNISYNVKLAKMIGVLGSVYLSATYLFLNKDNRNSEDSDFTINRAYLNNIAGLTKEDQIKAEECLVALGLAEITHLAGMDKIKLNPKEISKLIAENDPKKLDQIKEKLGTSTLDIKNDSKLSKRQLTANALKKYIMCSNPELSKAYRGWIDGVYANPNGFLSQVAIEIFQNTINSYTKGDLDLALELLEIATVGGYRDATWAIKEYEKRNPNGIKQKPQPLKPMFNKEEVF